MQISMMSSSEIEEASIGVPSPLVIDSKHNLLQNESVGGTSQSLEVVAEEVTDIFGGKISPNFTQTLLW